ncbi:MAG: hypothetical protein CMQ07_02410 [Gammaproteobacteria bacterium]|nr:hypothetical protein [Gammaproteobacteria bacterium]MAV52569.1 hypothetical protein [Gammaproteobacteria bacterium]OUX34604.1 MAG: hypothetical protein CBE20_01800 [Gammaproteobacteria bacterium TMED260]HBJ90205.1 hypothetical protein [Gammaproteobacteria bacterium]HCA36320.1 hypothetical protein [Gammaproteobacteria bacterium]
MFASDGNLLITGLSTGFSAALAFWPQPAGCSDSHTVNIDTDYVNCMLFLLQHSDTQYQA